MNTTGTFSFRATRVGADTALARIVALVEHAQGSKAPIQRLADRISEVFVPGVLAIAALTFAAWFVFGAEPRLTLALTSFIGVVDHRLPLRDGPCHADRDHGRDRPRGGGRRSCSGAVRRSSGAHRVDTVVFDKTGHPDGRATRPSSRCRVAHGWAEDRGARSRGLARDRQRASASARDRRPGPPRRARLPASSTGFAASAGPRRQRHASTVGRSSSGRPPARERGIEAGAARRIADAIAADGTNRRSGSRSTAMPRASSRSATRSSPRRAQRRRRAAAAGIDVWLITGDRRAPPQAVAAQVGIGTGSGPGRGPAGRQGGGDCRPPGRRPGRRDGRRRDQRCAGAGPGRRRDRDRQRGRRRDRGGRA